MEFRDTNGSVDNILTVTDSVQDAKDAVAKAKTAVTTAEDLIKKAQEIAKGKSTLATMLDFTKKLGGISEISFVIGIISAGIELVAFLSGQEDTQDKMVDILEQITNQIAELEDRMNIQFDRLKMHNDLSALNQKRESASTNLKNFLAILKVYNDFIKANPNAKVTDPGGLKMRKDDLIMHTVDIRNQVQVFSDIIKSNTLNKGIFDLSIDYTYGDINVVMDIGNSMLNLSIAAMQLDAVIHSIRYEETFGKDKDKLAKEVADVVQKLYQSLIDEIAIGLKEAIENCTSPKLINTYAKKYINEQMSSYLSESKLDDSAQYVGQKLVEHWYWYDWTVIAFVNNPNASFISTGVSLYLYNINNTNLELIISKINKEWNDGFDKVKAIFNDSTKISFFPSPTGNANSQFTQDYLYQVKENFINSGFNSLAMLWLHDDGESFGKPTKDPVPTLQQNTLKASFGVYRGSARCHVKRCSDSYVINSVEHTSPDWSKIVTICNGVIHV